MRKTTIQLIATPVSLCINYTVPSINGARRRNVPDKTIFTFNLLRSSS